MAPRLLPLLSNPDHVLFVNEHFGPTIQGESTNAGVPAYFVRLNGCDLHCSFCDTPQTWKKDVIEPGKRMTAQELLEAALKALPVRDLSRHQSLFVLTGGEPLLQQRRPAFRELLEGANVAGYQVEVETAGHHIPERFLHEMGGPVTQWNVSPKLAASGNDFIDYETTLRFYNETVRCFQRVVLKFVVGITDNLDAELEPIDALVRAVDWPESQVILMPEGITPDIINSKSAAVIEASISRGYRFGTRLHTLAWGNKRGV